MENQLEEMGMSPQQLFIKVIDGQPVDHPVFQANLLQVYESQDKIPPEYKPFQRYLQYVTPGPLQKAVCTYQYVNEQWCDVWEVVDMTEEEKTERTKEIHEWAKDSESAIRRKTERRITETTNEIHIAVFNRYLSLLDAWELDITNPKFPDPPFYTPETDTWTIPE